MTSETPNTTALAHSFPGLCCKQSIVMNCTCACLYAQDSIFPHTPHTPRITHPCTAALPDNAPTIPPSIQQRWHRFRFSTLTMLLSACHEKCVLARTPRTLPCPWCRYVCLAFGTFRHLWLPCAVPLDIRASLLITIHDSVRVGIRARTARCGCNQCEFTITN